MHMCKNAWHNYLRVLCARVCVCACANGWHIFSVCLTDSCVFCILACKKQDWIAHNPVCPGAGGQVPPDAPPPRAAKAKAPPPPTPPIAATPPPSIASEPQSALPKPPRNRAPKQKKMKQLSLAAPTGTSAVERLRNALDADYDALLSLAEKKQMRQKAGAVLAECYSLLHRIEPLRHVLPTPRLLPASNFRGSDFRHMLHDIANPNDRARFITLLNAHLRPRPPFFEGEWCALHHAVGAIDTMQHSSDVCLDLRMFQEQFGDLIVYPE